MDVNGTKFFLSLYLWHVCACACVCVVLMMSFHMKIIIIFRCFEIANDCYRQHIWIGIDIAVSLCLYPFLIFLPLIPFASHEWALYCMFKNIFLFSCFKYVHFSRIIASGVKKIHATWDDNQSHTSDDSAQRQENIFQLWMSPILFGSM